MVSCPETGVPVSVNTGTAFTAEAHNAYGYNDRNELTESSRFMGTDPDNITQPVEPEYRAYQYDPIGNRAQITEAANTGTFTANNLNQYTGQTVPGDGTRSFDYDADGNLISLIENGAEKLYTWNAENRLSSVAPRTPANGDKKIEFVYDYMGRRVKKTVSTWSTDHWSLSTIHYFLYDGWNLVEEITEAWTTQTSRYFVWGQDLSQSLQGAGGIGGLIATVDGAAEYLYCFDANGNVGQVVNAADGAIAAKYEYDPYGKPIKAEGVYAGDNPFRFSTKYHDDETGLVYYGYRYYSAGLGRWINRDPIGEKGEKNLYLFTKNNPIVYYDKLGLIDIYYDSYGKEICRANQNISLEYKFIEAPTGKFKFSGRNFWPVWFMDKGGLPGNYNGNVYEFFENGMRAFVLHNIGLPYTLPVWYSPILPK